MTALHSVKTVTEDHLIAPVNLLPPNIDELTPGPVLLKERVSLGARYQTISLTTLDAWHLDMVQWVNDYAPSPQGFLTAVEASLKSRPVLTLPSHPSESDLHPKWPISLDRWLPWLYLRRPYGLYGLWRLRVEGLYRDPKILPEPIVLADVHTMLWPTDSTSDAWLTGYVLNVMRRKVLLTYGYNLTRLYRLATVGVGLIRWYAKALAVMQDQPEPSQDDILLAIRLVERYYTGHQPNFFDSFDRGLVRQQINRWFCGN